MTVCVEYLLSLSYEEFIRIGISRNPVRKIMCQKYSDMLSRCNNKKSSSYKYYGGVGIKVAISREQFYFWFFNEFNNYYLKNNTLSCAISRIDHSSDYALGNMELQTRSDNAKEQHTRLPNPCRKANKLSVEQAKEIKNSLESRRDLAKKFGVTYTCVANIQKGRIWSKL